MLNPLTINENNNVTQKTNIYPLHTDHAIHNVIYHTENLNLWYGDVQALKNINLSIYEKEVTAIIGPSGCGKSTYLKTLNRMVERVPNVTISGKITYQNQNILDKSYQPETLRTRVGMVFQNPNPFPKSIYENIAYGPKTHGRSEERRVGKDNKSKIT